MDAFTESILSRARERQKLLEGSGNAERTPFKETNSLIELPRSKKESLSDSNINICTKNLETLSKENKSDSNLPKFIRQNSRTKISSEMPGSPKNQLKTLNIQQEDFNMEIKVTASENVRVEVEIAEANNSGNENDSGNDCQMRIESKCKLKRLGQLYAGGDDANISSPIHRTEAKFCAAEETATDEFNKQNIDKMPRKGLSKLAHLAETINQWEDDMHHVQKAERNSPKKYCKDSAPEPPITTPIKTSLKSKAPQSHVCIEKSETPKSPVKYLDSTVNEEIKFVKKVDSSTSQKSSLCEIFTPKKSLRTNNDTSKQVSWDKNVLDKLESQGFTRKNSSSSLVYSYNSQENCTEAKSSNDVKELRPIQEDKPKENRIKQMATALEAKVGITEKPSSPVQSLLRSHNIAERVAAFESPTRSNKDPALLSVSERKALFERNKGDALVPKAAFGMAPPVKVESTMKASCTKIITANTQSKPIEKQKVPPQVDLFNSMKESPAKITNKPESKLPAEETNIAAVQQAGGIASKMAALLENKTTISREQIEKNTRNERQKEMDMLLNRFNKNKEIVNVIEEASYEDDDNDIDATEETVMITEKHVKVVTSDNEQRRSAEKRKSGGKPYSKGDSPIVAAVLDDVKRIKVIGPKEGKLYPNLSDIEATTETEPDAYTRTPSPNDQNSSLETSNNSDNPNTSFGREIMKAVCINQSQQKRPIYDESTASDISSILDDMDNYLDDASNEDNNSVGPTPPKVRHVSPQKVVTQTSNSFSYINYSPDFSTPKTTNKSFPEYVVEGENILPLTHTVSFYRKQQNQIQSPIRQIKRQPIIEESLTESNANENEVVKEKIKELQEEVNRQQNIISQTSQALNLCSCTPEFSGSTEQVEAERVLLVATHRRQAALHELQRLKVEGTIRPQQEHSKNVPLEKGTLTISNIVLPLKHKYVKALAAAGGKGHHIVCLIKCGEQVIPTKLTSTVVLSVKNPDTELVIPGSVVIHNIYSDFTITFEVYCLQAQEEFLPHEVKYHINNKKPGNKLTTPKKLKQDSRMVMPIKESPAGPQAVRTSSFAIMGYVVFSVQAVNKRVWNLNNTPSMSPLEGTVEMRISCELAVSVEHKGFLTMFEDVSGFGAWHRRWCILKGHTLSYWKYPDDEKKMAPINHIDLKNCITENVNPVNRDICARLHTLLLEIERPAYSTDKDSLVTICKGDKTIIRHLLSADTKQERVEWCTKFNAALTALRMWGNSQQ
ncbi:anillin-like isoform X1 [Diorhabda carinulata]|uniref:anillin-like isoform X1 n=2 Tax=Diorhabda carinulata TaxID=1163345 RepID=UPI0025A06EE3|nr:anillin-like isoform X1 [Diorhabda carinulata]